MAIFHYINIGRIFFIAGWLILTVTPALSLRPQQSDAVATRLSAEKSFEHQMKGGEIDRYIIDLPAAQFIDLSVDQQGIDVVVQFRNPDGSQICEIDSANGDRGPER